MTNYHLYIYWISQIYIVSSKGSDQSNVAKCMKLYKSSQVKLAGNIQEKLWNFEKQHTTNFEQ